MSVGNAKREQYVLTFSDEDLQLVGIDPEKLSNEQFSDITDDLREHFNENFLTVLAEITKKFKDFPSFIVGKNDKWGRIG